MPPATALASGGRGTQHKPLNEALVDLKAFLELCAKEPLTSQGQGWPGGQGLLLLGNKQPMPALQSATAKGATGDLHWWRSVVTKPRRAGGCEHLLQSHRQTGGQKGSEHQEPRRASTPQVPTSTKCCSPGPRRVTERGGGETKPLETEDGCKAPGC